MAFAAINSAGKPIIAIEEAFATEPSLKKRVYDAIGAYPSWWRIYACLHDRDELIEHTLIMTYPIKNLGKTPQHTPLFEDLARYTSSLLSRTAKTASLPLVPPPSEGPAAKKRKIQNGEPEVTAQAPVDIKGDAPIQFYMQDISFAIPQRKKLTLEVTAGTRYLRARNQATKEVEFGIPMDRIRKFIPLCFPFSGVFYMSGFKSVFGNEVSLMLFNAIQ